MEKIVTYLEGENLDFQTALELYKSLPGCSQSQARRYEKRSNEPFIRRHIVGALEEAAGVARSNREALLGGPREVEVAAAKEAEDTEIREEIEREAYQTGFTLRIEDMSDEQRALVIRKRKLNRNLEVLQKELRATDEENTLELKEKRTELIARIQSISTEIKGIWDQLHPAQSEETETEKVEDKQVAAASTADSLAKLNSLKVKLEKQKIGAQNNKTEQGREKASAAALATQQEIEALESELFEQNL